MCGASSQRRRCPPRGRADPRGRTTTNRAVHRQGEDHAVRGLESAVRVFASTNAVNVSPLHRVENRVALREEVRQDPRCWSRYRSRLARRRPREQGRERPGAVGDLILRRVFAAAAIALGGIRRFDSRRQRVFLHRAVTAATSIFAIGMSFSTAIVNLPAAAPVAVSPSLSVAVMIEEKSIEGAWVLPSAAVRSWCRRRHCPPRDRADRQDRMSMSRLRSP